MVVRTSLKAADTSSVGGSGPGWDAAFCFPSFTATENHGVWCLEWQACILVPKGSVEVLPISLPCSFYPPPSSFPVSSLCLVACAWL